jgi:hypothetical protein
MNNGMKGDEGTERIDNLDTMRNECRNIPPLAILFYLSIG